MYLIGLQYECELNRSDPSESESAEEEFGVTCLLVLLRVRQAPESVAETLLQSLLELFAGLSSLEAAVLDVLEVEIVDNESGRHHMTLVDVFDEGFDTSALDELLLAERSFDLAKVAGDTGHQQMGESVLLSGARGTLLPSS